MGNGCSDVKVDENNQRNWTSLPYNQQGSMFGVYSPESCDDSFIGAAIEEQHIYLEESKFECNLHINPKLCLEQEEDQEYFEAKPTKSNITKSTSEKHQEIQDFSKSSSGQMNSYSIEALRSVESFCPKKHIITSTRIYVFPDDSTYMGDIQQMTRCGIGELILKNGAGYLGEWLDDMPHGEGRMVQENGDIYIGYFFRAAYHGKGVLVFNSNKAKYVGDFRNGLRHGQGKETYDDASFYEGYFFDDKKQGRGYFQFSDKSYYRGNFYNDKIEGIGMQHNL